MSQRVPFSTMRALAAALCLLPFAAAEAAEPSPETEIALEEALTGTLDLQPAIRIALQSRDRAEGELIERRGDFDFSFTAVADYTLGQRALTQREIDFEIGRRDLHHTIIREANLVIDDLEAKLREDRGLPIPDCGTLIVVVNGIDYCFDQVDRGDQERLRRLLLALANSTSDLAALNRLEEIERRQRDVLRQIAGNVILELRRRVATSEEALRLLGAVPDTNQTYDASLELRLTRQLRNGMVVSVGTRLEGYEDNYETKPLLAAYGGKGNPNEFTSRTGVLLGIPLGKNRGAGSAVAFERAAALGLSAAEADLRHSAARAALQAELAYWDLAATQQRLKVLDRQVETILGLRATARELAGKTIPEADLSRIEARLALLEEARARARRDLGEARLQLADAMSAADLPAMSRAMASDELPPALEIGALGDGLLSTARQGIENRQDLQALRQRLGAVDVLLDAAERNLARRIDLTLAAGFSGLYETYSDRVSDLDALGKALTDRQTGPSFSFNLRFDLPSGNRGSRARLEQTRARRYQAAIQVADLERSITAGIVDLQQGLASASRSVHEQELAASFFERSFSDAGELLKLGKISIFRLMEAEEQATRATVEVVARRRDQAILLSRLRYERGEMVSSEGSGAELELIPLLPAAAGHYR